MTNPSPRLARVYIAGPMRYRPFYNAQAFTDAAEALRSRGYAVESPAELDEGLGLDLYACPTGTEDTGVPISDLLLRDLELICRCDAVVLLPGWQHSDGAAVEIAFAKMLGLPRYELGELL